MNAKVYVWYDDELVNGNWRYDLTEVTRYERIDVIELPEGWTLGEAESSEVFAYDENGDAWKVVRFGRGYALKIAGGEIPLIKSVKTVSVGETA